MLVNHSRLVVAFKKMIDVSAEGSRLVIKMLSNYGCKILSYTVVLVSAAVLAARVTALALSATADSGHEGRRRARPGRRTER